MSTMPEDIAGRAPLSPEEFAEFIRLRDRTWSADEEHAAEQRGLTAASRQLSYARYLRSTPDINLID
jgi:hypothetical protein